jgi:hypothetical protein
MNRRSFYRRLGLTATAAIVSPKLLADEMPPEEDNPTLILLFGPNDEIKFPYLKAWKKPVHVGRNIEVMFLPKQLAWAKDMILINCDKGTEWQSQVIEIVSRTPVHALMAPRKVYVEEKPVKLL